MDIEIIEDSGINRQTGILQNVESINKASALLPLVGVWGIVQRVHSEDVSIDVKSTVGLEYRHIKVRSLAWVGVNDDRAFGERDIPPVGAKVFVLFPDGVDSPDTAFALCSVIDTMWTMKKSKDNLAVANKERERKIVTEIGWTITYDKDTGDVVIENDGNKTRITVKKSDGTIKVEAAGDVDLNSDGNITADPSGDVDIKPTGNVTIQPSGTVSVTSKGATISITSLGGINVTPATGQAIVLNNGVQNVNNLPVCLFSGAVHGTNIGAKA